MESVAGMLWNMQLVGAEEKHLGGFLATQLFSIFEPVALIAGFYDVTVMGHSVQERCGHFGIPKNLRPFSKAEVGGHNNGCPFVKHTDQVKQQCSSCLGKRQVAKLIQDDKINSAQGGGQGSRLPLFLFLLNWLTRSMTL